MHHTHTSQLYASFCLDLSYSTGLMPQGQWKTWHWISSPCNYDVDQKHWDTVVSPSELLLLLTLQQWRNVWRVPWGRKTSNSWPPGERRLSVMKGKNSKKEGWIELHVASWSIPRSIHHSADQRGYSHKGVKYLMESVGATAMFHGTCVSIHKDLRQEIVLWMV